MAKETKSNQDTDVSAEHDPGALEEAERKMLLREDATETSKVDPSADWSEEHDPGALEEAERKMLRRDDGKPAGRGKATG